MDALPAPPPHAAVRLILCRHGETALNADHILQGSGVNPPLNDRGRAQARLLGARLAKERIDWIVSSELLRARQTADEVAAHHPTVPRDVFADLAEISWGVLEGTKSPDIAKLHTAWDQGDFDYSAERGESPKQVSQRAGAQLFALIDEARRRPRAASGPYTIAIVIHGRLLRILLATLLHRSLFCMPAFSHTNCNINVLDFVTPPSPITDLPLLRTLPPADLAAFAETHFAQQAGHPTSPPPHVRLDAAPAMVNLTHAHVWGGKPGDGILAVPWTRADIGKWTTIEDVAKSLECDEVVTDVGADGFWLVGTLISETGHLVEADADPTD
ncbi:hypothetical protein H9P43_006140 [Blastocladiella emersonii ATCC 22665]|nr:hypothetical protein H9P43_006140 [Blastocladiella emersonii ATCC 22665]